MWYAVVVVPSADDESRWEWRAVRVDEAQARSMRERDIFVTRMVRQARAVARRKNSALHVDGRRVE